MSLRVHAEPKKTTEFLNILDMKNLINYLNYNMNCQNAHVRQQMCTLMLKILKRFQNGYQILLNNQLKDNNNDQLINVYLEFILELKEFCENNIFKGGNFSRRTISLYLLYEIIKILIDIQQIPINKDNHNNNNNITNDHIWTDKLFQKLYLCITDTTIEQNKEFIMKILNICPDTHLKSMAIVPMELKSIEKLLINRKSKLSINGTNFLEYYLNVNKYFQNIYEIIIWCEKLLNNCFEIAKISIMNASKNYPIYGILYCMKYFLMKLNFQKLSQLELEQWKSFLKRFISTCINVTEIFGVIVKNSSPEGYMPSNNNYDDDDDEDTNIENNNYSNNRKIPQLLLICSWRTIKEISLIFGHLTLNAGNLLTNDIIINLGNYFQQMLIETKHRGAFELTYIGFQQLCQRLWCEKNDLELYRLPMLWLTQLLTIVEGSSSSTHMDAQLTKNFNNIYKICATRRSAGIPFMIQGIIIAELKLSSCNAFYATMDRLIEICLNGHVTESRTHSLNILRALFR